MIPLNGHEIAISVGKPRASGDDPPDPHLPTGAHR